MVLNSSSFVFLNSRDKLSGSNTDFTIFLSNYNYARGLVSIAVEELHFFNVQYPINARNNILTFYEDQGAGELALQTITFPVGVYTATQLIAQLKTSLELGSSTNTYTVAYNNITHKISIDVATGTSLRFDWTQTDYPMQNVIGFDNETITSPIILIANNPINVTGELYVDLELGGWANNNILSSRTSNSIFHRIPLQNYYGSYINYQASLENDHTYLSDEQLQTIEVRLLNPDGTVYDLPSSFNLSIVLRITKV